VIAIAIPMAMVVSCSSQKGLSKKQKQQLTEQANNPSGELTEEQILQKMTENVQTKRFITSKVKFTLEVGSHQMTLTGNLKMKRDDVIRLQLMAFGFVEAGRLEFTQDYVLIMDRINKQYLKVPYAHLDFLRNNGIDFYVLQSMFWNEVYTPGKKSPLAKNKAVKTAMEDANMVISLENEKLSYRWLADKQSAQIKMANIMYRDRFRGNYILNWDYEEFKYNDRKLFPMTHKIMFSTPDKQVKMGMKLNYMGSDEEWEPRTEVSSKYRQVEVDDILRRFMSL
jgi:hypothetical protein